PSKPDGSRDTLLTDDDPEKACALTPTRSDTQMAADAKSENLEVLTRRRDALNQRIWAVEKRERAQHAEKLVGRCFRYRNSYSCPKDESERWWLYRRVLRL